MISIRCDLVSTGAVFYTGMGVLKERWPGLGPSYLCFRWRCPTLLHPCDLEFISPLQSVGYPVASFKFLNNFLKTITSEITKVLLYRQWSPTFLWVHMHRNVCWGCAHIAHMCVEMRNNLWLSVHPSLCLPSLLTLCPRTSFVNPRT